MKDTPFYDFFLQHIDFAIEYISLHYPFTAAQVMENLPYLIKGSAFYSEFIPETGSMMRPTIGLSFNQNIPWALELKRQWKIGWQIASPDCNSEYGGYYDPENGSTIVWGGIAPEKLFDIIPLDAYKELVDQKYVLNDYYNGQGVALNEVIEDKVYTKLTLMELIELYYYDSKMVLYNDSIWENTFKEVLTWDIIKRVIATYKQEKNLI